MDTLSRGDLLLYEGSMKSPLDIAIMMRTKSNVVHASFVVDGANTVQAQSKGIVYTDPGNWKYLVRTSILINDKSRLDSAAQWALSKVGKPYGFADLVNQELMQLGDDPLLLDMSYDCSHLAACFLWIAGVPLEAWMIDANTVTPADLYKWAVVRDIIEERSE